ncbi:ribonuclease H2 subunit C [Entomortierella parvispora]|uniref:Ribonuclease H2 subunit C n=1 Tax=Entomortierella parvispora TaxID=205924 RepID=A0A9P3H877_9FUNG|nr:ribonuclease H2 subunit C [Entomortierella parvispora]
MESILEQASSHTKVLDHTSLHLLPCGIQHDGPANIPGFFFLVDGQYPSSSSTSTSTTTTTATTTTESTENTSMTIDATVQATTIATTESLSSSSTTSVSDHTAQSTPETSFRGRTLKATVLQVPQGYIGSLYQPYDAAPSSSTTSSGNSAMDLDQDPDQDDEEREYEAMLRGMQEERKTLRTTHQFNEFSIWGHDDAPTPKNDKVLKAMQWIDIANVLHQPVC